MAATRKLVRRSFVRGLLFGAAVFNLASCATTPQPQLVADPSAAAGETALPWNQQERWETTGQLGPMADQFGGTGSRR